MLQQGLNTPETVFPIPYPEPNKCNKCKRYLKKCLPVFITLLLIILIIGCLTFINIYEIKTVDGSSIE